MEILNSVAFDPSRGHLRAHAAGLWDLEEALRLRAGIERTVYLAVRYGRPIDMLVDLRGLALHTSEVAQAVEAAVTLLQPLEIRRYAMVIEGALLRMQAKRINSALTPTFFDSSEEAVAWLGWAEADLARLRRAA